ncbi:MAG: c-type cytochrome [Gammaproteobacteria bacterium]|jgi:mono/diheme cytochrome c family protein|nr:c-type cytochrome [Gammaproteobacteria bacterium]
MKGVGAITASLKTVVLLVLPLLVSCSPRDEHFGYGPTGFASNGERIYFTGTSASGKAITASGGTGMMNMHRQMHGGGCAVCHGAKREGQRLWPQFWIKAPALTAEALFADDHADDGHGDHGSYDSASLGKAITDGIDPDGKQLDAAMPRWSMSGADLADLIAYLQQSHTHD